MERGRNESKGTFQLIHGLFRLQISRQYKRELQNRSRVRVISTDHENLTDQLGGL